jgi:hypothetical protein
VRYGEEVMPAEELSDEVPEAKRIGIMRVQIFIDLQNCRSAKPASAKASAVKAAEPHVRVMFRPIF